MFTYSDSYEIINISYYAETRSPRVPGVLKILIRGYPVGPIGNLHSKNAKKQAVA